VRKGAYEEVGYKGGNAGQKSWEMDEGKRKGRNELKKIRARKKETKGSKKKRKRNEKGRRVSMIERWESQNDYGLSQKNIYEGQSGGQGANDLPS